jgi:uncharacterized RDD family membrane protein YckC
MSVEGNDKLVIAGFWHRILAFVIDMLILGIAGWAIGMLFYSTLARIGAPARLIGFFIALAYFGVLNSRIGGGQTLANRWLGIRVVDARGEPLSLPRALLRYSVLGIPYFLNGLPLPGLVLTSFVVSSLLALLVFGAGFSIIYLYLFNRKTRQSLHDLIVGSYVVSAKPEAGEASFPPIWRGHWAVVTTLVVLSLSTPAIAGQLMTSKFFDGMMPMYQAVQAQPHVINAVVNRGASSFYGNKGHSETHYLSAALRVDQPITEDKDYARNIAHIISGLDPNLAQENVVTVQLTYGFDIGIASGWKSQTYRFGSGNAER